jgi:hypothetical protein
LRCLNEKERRRKFPVGEDRSELPFFLGVFDDLGGLLLGLQQLLNVGSLTHVDIFKILSIGIVFKQTITITTF